MLATVRQDDNNFYTQTCFFQDTSLLIFFYDKVIGIGKIRKIYSLCLVFFNERKKKLTIGDMLHKT